MTLIDKFEVHGGQQLKDKMAQMTQATKVDALKAAATAGAWPVQNQAKINVHKRTGNLGRSIHNEVVSTGQHHATVSVGTNSVYARMEEMGGIIRPRNAKRLAWQDENGRWHFARQVMRKAHPFLRPAFDTQKHRAEAEAIDVLLKIAGLK